jgi:CRISPR-associated endoribonuclease Cas6
MPSTLELRMAGAIPDLSPRWLLRAAAQICGAGPGRGGFSPFAVGLAAPVGADGPAADPAVPDPNGPARPSRDGEPADALTWSWRLGWLDDESGPPGWPPAEARFGSQALAVVGAELRPVSYAELARSHPARRVTLTMTTPTYFTVDGRDLPLPDPLLVMRGLLARWNNYAPRPLRIGPGDARALLDAVHLAGTWGASTDVELGHGLRQTGFVGQAELGLLSAASDYVATMFTALARFAGYAGVGARTTYGFGSVDVAVDPAAADAAARRLTTLGGVGAQRGPVVRGHPAPRLATTRQPPS